MGTEKRNAKDQTETVNIFLTASTVKRTNTNQRASDASQPKEDINRIHHNWLGFRARAMVEFLKINSFRTKPYHAKGIETIVILLSEPNRNAVKNRKDWFRDDDLNTTIKLEGRPP
ncbi:hypothetical protein JTB14_008840 [Gonioctena quinquepunctata]|nr:hypothetical protein JTB14_008840 [Gonioctena quinquepunctata]